MNEPNKGRKEYLCLECGLYFNATESRVKAIMWCPYCGKQMAKMSKLAEWLKDEMQRAKEGLDDGELDELGYDDYFWGMIDLAKHQELISEKELSYLHDIRRKLFC